MARRIAFSESRQAVATSGIVSRRSSPTGPCRFSAGLLARSRIWSACALVTVQVVLAIGTVPNLSRRGVGYKYVFAIVSVACRGSLTLVRSDTVVSASLIREARMRAGLSQAQLSERSGKAKVQIGRWETGAVAPSLDTLLELVRVCGFDLPLMLEPYRPVDDRPLTKLQRYSPERRLQNMLTRLERDEAQ